MAMCYGDIYLIFDEDNIVIGPAHRSFAAARLAFVNFVKRRLQMFREELQSYADEAGFETAEEFEKALLESEKYDYILTEWASFVTLEHKD